MAKYLARLKIVQVVHTYKISRVSGGNGPFPLKIVTGGRKNDCHVGDNVVATAILDRLLHHSTVVTLRGDSYRLLEKRRSGLIRKEQDIAGQ